MGRGVRTAVIGSVFAVMVGGAGYGAFNIVSALNGDGGGSGSSGPAPERTGPPSSGEIKQTSAKFFTAWERGKAAEAATYTNNDAAAGPLLTAYGQDAHITGVKITPGTASGATVPFTVKATVSYEGRSKPSRTRAS